MREHLNIRPTVVLLAAVVLLAGGVALAHRWQTRRNLSGLLDLAQTAEAKGRPDRASWLLASYLAAAPGDTAAQARYGIVAESLARDAKSLRAVMDVYERVLMEDPGQVDVRTRLARIYVRGGLHSEAAPHLAALNAETADNAEFACLLAACQEAQGQTPLAVKNYRRAIDLDPRSVGQYVRLALLLRRAGDTPGRAEADRVIDRMVEANPQDAAAHLARAQYRVNYQTGDPEPDVRSALQLAPTDAVVLLTASGAAKTPEKAREYLQVALEHHPADERIYLALAGVESKAGQRQTAIAVLQKGAAKLPGHSRVLFTLANMMIEAGQLPEAERVLAEIGRWKLSPERVVLLRCRLRMAEGNWQAAREIIEAGRPVMTTAAASLGAEADMLLGRCYEQLGEEDLALAAYRRAAAGDPSRSDAPASVARALVGIGRLGEAVEQYRLLAAAPGATNEQRLIYARLRTLQYLASPPGSRRPDELEPAFAQAAEKMPGATELLLLRAEVLVADRKPAEAEKLLRDALARRPEAVEVALPLARLLQREDKSAEAWRVLDAIERKSGPSVELVLTRLGLIPVGTDARAAAALAAGEQRFARLTRPDEQVRLASGLAETQTRWRNLAQARRWWQEVARLRPSDLSVRFRLFDLAVQADDRAQMEETVRDIHRTEGGSGAFGHYAEVLLRLARPKDHSREGFQEARQHLMSAALLRPTWANIPASRAVLSELEGRPDEALADYTRAVELGERRPPIIRRAVQLLCARRRYPEADRLIQRLRPEGYITTELHKLAAEVSLFNLETQRAVDLAAEVVAPESRAYQEHLWQAEILAAAGRAKEALAAFRRAVDVAGSHGAPWVALVRYHVRTAQKAQAEAVVAEMGRRLTGPELPLTRAQCYEAVWQVEPAEKAYRAAVEARPDDREALRQLVGFHDRAGTPAQSVPVLRRALAGSLPPADAAWARQALAVALALGGGQAAFDEALRLVDQNLAADPGNTAHLLTRVRVLATRLSRRREALQLLQRVQQQRRLQPAEEFLLGQLYADTGTWADGRRVLVNLLAREGDNPTYLRFFVDRLLRNGETGEAEAWLDRLERTGANDLGVTRLRATFLLKRGDYREAAALVRQASRPGKAGADRDRLRAAARLGEELGRQSSDAGAALNPVAEALFREAAKGGTAADELALAGFLGRSGKVTEAVALGRAAEKAAGSAAVANTLLSVAYTLTPLTDAQLDAVEAELRACLGRAKPSPSLGAMAGLMHARRSRYAEAAQAFRKVVEANGSDAGMLNNLAYMLVLANTQPDEARAVLDRAITLVGPSAGLLDTRAMAHLLASRTAEAIADLERALDQDATASRCLHLAVAYQRADRPKDAAALLNRADALRPDGSLVLPAEREQYQKLARELNMGR